VVRAELARLRVQLARLRECHLLSC
jgi:hypothetical protein